MITIRELSKILNLSTATISRILNNDESFAVSQETREKVLKAAKEYNYNPFEKRKASSKSRLIVTIMNSTTEKHDDSYYTTIMSGIKDGLKKYNYVTEHFTVGVHADEKRILGELLKDSAKGVVLLTTPPDEILEIIESHTKNIVCADTSLTEYDNVRYNRFEAGCKAMHYLITNGHKKIAFIGSHIPYNYSLQFGRYDAYRFMMRRYHYPVHNEWIIDCKWQRDICFEKTQKLLTLKNKPTAIFVASDYMAMASIAAINQAGLNVPQDISIIGISNIEESRYLNPPLTTISIPQYEIGQIIAGTLINRINGDTTPPKQIYVPTKLLVRKSVCKIK